MSLFELDTRVFIEDIPPPAKGWLADAVYAFNTEVFSALPPDEQTAVMKRARALAESFGAECGGYSKEIILTGDPRADIPHAGEHFMVGLAGVLASALLSAGLVSQEIANDHIEGETLSIVSLENNSRSVGFIRLKSPTSGVPSRVLEFALKEGTEIFDRAISDPDYSFEDLARAVAAALEDQTLIR